MKKGITVFWVFLMLLSVCLSASAQKTDFEQFSRRPSSEPEQVTEVPVAEIPRMQPGDIVVFGHYEQDIIRENGKEPIEWLVLTVEDDRALMLSLYGLDAKPYHAQEEETTWETSWIRKWLNETFYSSAFDDAEKNRISAVTNTTRSDGQDPSKKQNDTVDTVFLLSIDEVEAYLTTTESRLCKKTKNAIRSGADPENETGFWWLRDGNGMRAASVRSDGHFGEISGTVYVRGGLIRPAFWLDLSEPEQLADLVGTPAPTPSPMPPKVISVEAAKKLGLEIPTPVGKEVLYLGEAKSDHAGRILAVFTKNPQKSLLRNLKVFVYKANFQSGNVKVKDMTVALSAIDSVGVKNGKAESGTMKFSNFEFTEDGAKANLTCTVILPSGGSYTFNNLEMNFVKITEP